MIDIQCVTAEIRRGKKEDERKMIEEETTGRKHNGLGGHNNSSWLSSDFISTSSTKIPKMFPTRFVNVKLQFD